MALPHDWKEFIACLNSRRVDYLVVGAIAVSWHAYPRNTGDLDVLIRPTAGNARRVCLALSDFGFGSLGIHPDDLIEKGKFIRLGRPPRGIDLLNEVTGVAFDEAWPARVVGFIDGIEVALIGREALIRNKEAAGRDKDRADLAILRAATKRRLP